MTAPSCETKARHASVASWDCYRALMCWMFFGKAAVACVLSVIGKTGLEFLGLCTTRCMWLSHGWMRVFEQAVWTFGALYNLLMNYAFELDVETKKNLWTHKTYAFLHTIRCCVGNKMDLRSQSSYLHSNAHANTSEYILNHPHADIWHCQLEEPQHPIRFFFLTPNITSKNFPQATKANLKSCYNPTY